MDIFTHAIVGAASGAAFGQPVAGALAGIAPDFCIWFGKRRAKPPEGYLACHSLLGVVAAAIGTIVAIRLFDPGNVTLFYAIMLAWVSHIALDAITHGETWAPRLLYPSPLILNVEFNEWEFFNLSWWRGAAVAAIWSALCVLPIFDIGFPF